MEGFEYPYYDAKTGMHHAYILEPIRRRLSGLPIGARVMDLGCGNGSLTAGLAHKDWQVFGVDSSESGIRIASAAHPRSILLVAGLAPGLRKAYGPASFDAVVSAEVIEHVYAPRAFVQCAFSLLRPGGMFLISTPYHGYLKNVALAISGNMDRHWSVLWDGGHIKFWSWKTICQLLEEAGFENPSFAGAGRLPFLWKSMVVACRKPSNV